MADIIQLLPDSIANQIAAGEVVQRPASVVKELLENSIDAGADDISLILSNAGKSLIQVIDNGMGMSEMDARMSFERHATSKIRNANDLFTIKTMGFRGEALASIAAISKVDMITRKADEELATHIVIEGSRVMKQEPAQGQIGTNISVKNLFYNVPARRKFLKSDSTEYKHALDEFYRIVLANPQIKFSLYHNNNKVHSLPKNNLRQRIVSVSGKNMNERLVPISLETEDLMISGFIAKPEAAKKSRGDQFFFVNNRFIKSNYLNHAVKIAYEDLIPSDHNPVYYIKIDLDASKIDVNVHPTKQEIKFEEERIIYNYIKVSVRHALGQYSLTPMLDFDADMSFSRTVRSSASPASSSSYQQESSKEKIKNWEQIYEGMITIEPEQSDVPVRVQSDWIEEQAKDQEEKTVATGFGVKPYQLHSRYLINPIKSGFLIIDQSRASERIFYEEYLESLNNQEVLSQKKLFPKPIDLSTSNAEILNQIKAQLFCLGLEIEEFGKNSFIIHSVPLGLEGTIDETQLVEELIEQFRNNLDLKMEINESLAAGMATKRSIKVGQSLKSDEMQNLIDRLFACENPYTNPYGQKCFITFTKDELKKQFNS